MTTNIEAKLISSVLRDKDIAEAVSRGVTADMFRLHADEWAWLVDYYEKYRGVPSKAAFKDMFPEFRIKTYNDTPHLSDLVRQSFTRRTLTAAMADSADFLAGNDINKAMETMQAAMVTTAAQVSPHKDTDILRDYSDIFADIEARAALVKERGSAGLDTGFPTLDARTGGPQPGDLWVVGARLGEGKTWTLMKMAKTMVENGHSVLFVALEMTRGQVAMRFHNLMSDSVGSEIFGSTDLMRGKINTRRYGTFLGDLRDSIPGRLHVVDQSRGRVSPMALRSMIEKVKPEAVFVDYLTLMDKQGDGDWKSVAKLSGDLKVTGVEYGVPMIVASQLNRAEGLSKEPPGPEALAQSDAVGQDADLVITQRMFSKRTMKQKVVKSRHAQGGFAWWMVLDPERGVFKEADYDQAQAVRDKDDDEKDKQGG